MATGKITKRTVDALQPTTKDEFLWDTDLRGFGVKITAAGTVSYIIQFRMGGRESSTRRYTIGTHGSPWTPTTARAEAVRLLMLVAQGIDPVEADKKRRREAVDLAFENYADLFEKSCKGQGWSRMVERVSRLYLKPVLICPLLSGSISILELVTKEEWNGEEAQAGGDHRQVA